MNNFKKVRSLFAMILLLAMIVSTFALSSCDIFGEISNVISGGNNHIPVPDTIDDNNRTLYQIYVRSFADSDGDGVGDIRGIIETFDLHLNDGDMSSGTDLGVQAIWLTPIFEGNSLHNYDAKDFYAVDEEFGTIDDLVELAELCEERNVKLILDLALNHTSSTHKWFTEFKKAHQNGDKSNKYYDYYSWSSSYQTGYVQVDTGLWVEMFDPADGTMPELNYNNKAVQNEMLNVAKFWLDLGVDGFRFDAIKHIYASSHSDSASFLKWYTDELRKIKPDIYLIGECWESNVDTMLQYYSAMSCFNFNLSNGKANDGVILNLAKGSGSISNFTNSIVSLQNKIRAKNSNGMMSNFLSNHDMNRFVGSVNQRKMAANLYLLTPGTPTIYYGEEIGMTGAGESVDDIKRRLPFKWGDTWTCEVPSQLKSNSSDDNDPEYIKYSNYVWDYSNSADEQRYEEDSLLIHYTKVLKIRHTYSGIARGTYSVIDCGKSTLGGFYIKHESGNLVLLHNTSSQEVTINLATINNSNLKNHGDFEIADYVGVGDASLDGTVLTLGPQTSVIIQ